jgi:hypothetical protein
MEFIVSLTKSIIEMISKMLLDWPIGSVLGVILSGAILIVIWLVLSEIFCLIDSCFLPIQKSMGEVREKEFTPAHITYISVYDAALKTSRMQPVYHSDEWMVTVEMQNKGQPVEVDLEIEKELFEKISKDTPVLVDYVTGRFSGSIYPKDLMLA